MSLLWVTPKDVEEKWFKNRRKVLNANLLTPELNGKGIRENTLNGLGSLCHKKHFSQHMQTEQLSVKRKQYFGFFP